MISYPRPDFVQDPILPLASSIGDGGWIMYFSLFLDESGKSHRHNQDFTALCGYFGGPDDWGRFVEAWKKLRTHWVVPDIHMSKIMRADQQEPKNPWTPVFQKITGLGIDWKEWRDSMLKDFAQLVFQYPLVCVGAVVDAAAYKLIKQTPNCKLVQQDTNVFSLQESVWLALEAIKIVDLDPSITLVIDDDKDTAYDYYQNFKVVRSVWDMDNPHRVPGPRFEMMKRCVNAIAFAQDKYHPALQAADMIAYEAARFKRPQVVGRDIPPEDLYALLTMGGTHQPKFYDKDALLLLAQGTNEAIEMLREKSNCEGL